METNYDSALERSISEIVSVMKGRGVSDEDISLIRDAFDFARAAHDGQTRKTGQPYIIHPVAVAAIVAEELELGTAPVIAAFLHDVVEDTDHTIDEIRERYGEDVAFLVDTVTKRKKEKYAQSLQIDNFKQMLESINYDIRALLLKLADRLHNMRTLSSMRVDKQMKIAGETDFFFAPLANRLGLYHIKCELEDLSFKYRCPREYASVEKQLSAYRESEEARIGTFSSGIEEVLKEHHIDSHIQVVFRPPYSSWKKMAATGGDFQHIEGKYYIRIIFKNPYPLSEKDMSLKIYSLLSDIFKEKPGSVTNYIDNPKENGYQSFHVKFLSGEGVWEEVHISSERMFRNNKLGCSAERTEDTVALWIEKFKSRLKDMAMHVGEIGFMEGVTSSFYNDDIMVFTPEGKGVILPKNSTALDFAFEIHSQLGAKAQYARINGVMSSIKTVLHRGDCVTIVEDDCVKVQQQWLDYVCTYKAKRYIRTVLAHREDNHIRRCRKCLPLPGDDVVGFKGQDGLVTVHRRNCQQAVSQASQYADSIVDVSFEENPDNLYPVKFSLTAVDRYHLLSDLIEVIADRMHFSMDSLEVNTKDYIVSCVIKLRLHSINELTEAVECLSRIQGVEEVQYQNISNL